MDAGMTSRRPMEAGEIIDAAVNLYRENAALFIGILAILLVPQAILDFISPAFGLLSFLTSTVSLGALIIAIASRYRGQPITIGDAYSALGVGTFVTLLLTNIVAGVLIAIGFVLVIIPGIYLLVRFALIDPIVVIERVGVFEALSRSSTLVKGSWWRVFGIGVLVFILVAIANGVLGFVLGRILSNRAANGIGELVGVVVYPFAMSALVLLYHDLRLRKEGTAATVSSPDYVGGPYTS